VTRPSFVLPNGSLLVATTGLDRRIDYCNPAFIDASGYARCELVGQPLDLLDHPDMPEQVMRDLWSSLEAGTPGSVQLKSRRKNGDSFWVCSTVAPVREGTRNVGYMVVRVPAAQAQVQAAVSLYATLRQTAEG
jgi:aerotaxis receptor